MIGPPAMPPGGDEESKADDEAEADEETETDENRKEQGRCC